MDHGSVFRRCGCRDQEAGRLLGARCPKLGSARHGTWDFSADLPSAAGDRRRVRRGGFTTRAAAVAALEALSGPAPAEARGLTTGEWLGRWLASRVSLRASTSRGYAAHVRGYLVPYLGGIRWASCRPPTCSRCSPRSSAARLRWVGRWARRGCAASTPRCEPR